MDKGDVVQFAGGRYTVASSFTEDSPEGPKEYVIVSPCGWTIPVSALHKPPVEKTVISAREKIRLKLMKQKQREEREDEKPIKFRKF
ncbi:MAG: hypothetical protein ABW007_18950 [Chitinophagaceae bacterium]